MLQLDTCVVNQKSTFYERRIEMNEVLTVELFLFMNYVVMPFLGWDIWIKIYVTFHTKTL